MRTLRRVTRTRWTVAAVAFVALVGLAGMVTFPSPASADPPTPHLGGSVATGTCAACHRTHTGQNDQLLKSIPQGTLCFSCHDGTGSMYNVASEYADVNVPANNATTSSFYSHPSLSPSTHTSARDDEFAGVLNRHAQCSDCHNPHTLSSVNAAPTAAGWIASGSLSGTTGVAATLTWKDPLSYEYELCLKCHSRYTQLLTYTNESQRKTDKAAEFDPANESYHPVRAPGKNTTTEMNNSLAGGSLWRYTTASTIRCLNCHANGSLSAGAPAWDGKLAPHASRNRGLLLANYRDRDLKPQSEAYSQADFTLCYLCHSAAPFTDKSGDSRNDTNFRFHGYHMIDITNEGSGGVDIDTLGAGQGNALCAECHFQLHSTRFAPYAGNQAYSRGVNFAPNVQPQSGQGNPLWSGPTSRTCSLMCHGKNHDAVEY